MSETRSTSFNLFNFHHDIRYSCTMQKNVFIADKKHEIYEIIDFQKLQL